METVAESETNGGASRPSGSVESSPEVMRSIASFLASRGSVIAGSGEDLAALSSGVADLLKQGDRSRMLLDLAANIRPYGVDVDRWLTWFDGGRSPLLVNGLERAVTDPRASSAILDRKTKQATRINSKLETARRAHEAAGLVVEKLEAEAQLVQATNAAVLEFAIFEHMTKLMNSTLAVGPLWTFARAIGAVDPYADPDVSQLSDAQIEKREAAAADRLSETELIFRTLDFMCGDRRFEHRLRAAMLRVVKESKADIANRDADGYKPRPLMKIRTTMPASSLDEARQILNGLPQI